MPRRNSGHRLAQVPLDPGERLAGEVPRRGKPQRGDLHDEIRVLARDHARREVPDRDDHREENAGPDQGRLPGQGRQHPQDDPELRRAGHAQGQEQDHDQPLPARAEDPGRHRGHRVAAQAQDHRHDGAPVQAHQAERLVGHDREPGQIPRVLEHAEGEEEGRHDRQNDRDRVGQAHRDEPVGARHQVREKGPRGPPLEEAAHERVDDVPEQPLLQEPHQGSRAEDPHEEVQAQEHPGDDGQAPERMHPDDARAPPPRRSPGAVRAHHRRGQLGGAQDPRLLHCRAGGPAQDARQLRAGLLHGRERTPGRAGPRASRRAWRPLRARRGPGPAATGPPGASAARPGGPALRSRRRSRSERGSGGRRAGAREPCRSPPASWPRSRPRPLPAGRRGGRRRSRCRARRLRRAC